MTPRRVLSLLALALCASALVGCGGDALALDPVAKAATTTAKTQASRFDFHASMTAGAAGSFSFHGNGIFDGHHGLVMYMRSPLFDRVVPTGKWVKMDVAKLAKKQGMDLGALMNANQADPSQSLRMLMASSGARVTGAERIRGVETTHYAFNIDFKKLAHDNRAFRQLTDKTGSISAPAEAWVDRQGRVRRLSVTMTMGAALGTPMTMSITEDLYDFGERTPIAPPPESLVVDFDSLSGSSS